MARNIHLLKKLLAVSILAGLGFASAAKADTVTFTNQQIYYVGPESTDNPFGLTNPTGNPITSTGLTSAGAAGTLKFDTGGTPGVSLVSNTPGVFNIQLYGNTSGIISGGNLVTGTYTFSSPLDTFTIGGASNSGSNPIDIATINVAANGIITLQSASLQVVTDPTPSNVPEIDPANAMSAFALIAIGLTVIRRRK